MAKPKYNPFTPKSGELKPLADKYLELRSLKKQAAEDSRWRLYETYERQMKEVRVTMTQVVAQRLIATNKLPKHKKHLLSIRYVTTPWGASWWEWFTAPVYTVLTDETVL